MNMYVYVCMYLDNCTGWWSLSFISFKRCQFSVTYNWCCWVGLWFTHNQQLNWENSSYYGPNYIFITQKNDAIIQRKMPLRNSIARSLPVLLCWPLQPSVIKKKGGSRSGPTIENAFYVICYISCDTRSIIYRGFCYDLWLKLGDFAVLLFSNRSTQRFARCFVVTSLINKVFLKLFRFKS